MRNSWLAVFAMATCALGACDRDKPAASPDAGSPTAPVAAERGLGDQAVSVLRSIHAIETQKDVTCWTSFRQLDQFIATHSYSGFAQTAKIQAQKAMVRAVWESAAKNSKSPVVGAEDIKAAISLRDVKVSDEERTKLRSFATDLGVREFEEYGTTGEHYRVLLAVTFDAMAYSDPLKPISDDGLSALADVAMQLSLELLKGSGRAATDARSPYIEGVHIKTAHNAIMKHYRLRNSKREAKPIDAKFISGNLYPLTGALIEAKVDALKQFNKNDSRSPLKTEDTLAALNAVSELPLTEDGLKVLVMRLRSYARFVAGGLEPMRNDNYLSDGSYAPSKLPRRLYVDALWMENVIHQTWPHLVMPNGDLKLRLEPNPGTVVKEKREPRDILLLDHQMNAVRDSAVHWEVLRAEFGERPFALDPFAAEMLSEVLSGMMTQLLVEGARIAKAEGKTSLDSDVVKRVYDKTYVQVVPADETARPWTDEDKARKDAVLAAYAGDVFRDVSSKSGLPVAIDLKAVDAAVDGADIQRVMGGGLAVGDVNGDQLPDLFLCGEGLTGLYLNSGKGLRLVDASKAWGIPPDLHDARGALFVDLNADSKRDLIVIRSAHPSLVLLSDGSKFTEAVDGLGIKTHNGAHVVNVFDYDGDGDLDVYIGYYGADDVNQGTRQGRSLPSMDGRNGSANQLFRQGADGRFTLVENAAGANDQGWALAASTVDFDRDGDLDLYVANDFGRNAFFRNDNGTFVDIASETQTADRGSGMNVSFSDIDDNGWLDLYVTNIDMFSKSIKVIFPTNQTTIDLDESLQRSFQYLAGNKLYLNRGEGELRDRFETAELDRFEPGDRGWGWDANFFDFDHDGDEDVYVANGWIEGSYAHNQRNQLFVMEDGFFYHFGDRSAAAFPGNTRSVASVDLDRDGDLDLVVNNFRQPPRVLENTQSGGGWLAIDLVGGGRNLAAIGAEVTVVAGKRTMRRQMTGGRGYLSQDEALHFGLGDATEAEATIRWPSGQVTKQPLAANKRHLIRQ